MDIMNLNLKLFYGQGCPHCKKMIKNLKELKEEFSFEVKKYEVYENEENRRKLEKISRGKCSGVPFIISQDKKDYICGSTSYEKTKEWLKEVLKEKEKIR
ncbi:MAG: Thioredoxin [Candidatus Methanohalarchaeum thermophilum]|uniref:Thioredoxin n=1 Tax=Methanohalarchaeum thermophilum TaxID=1903181 RepID=A0A1Q6DX71_METT1|nr:MAG: Thioredoxin [Candidatus Methanohalarchaeum thermophilum]